MSRTNSGSSVDVIAAINHVIYLKERDKRKSDKHRTEFVMSISLGVQASKKCTALDDAVSRAAQAGIVPIIAAGNTGQDACTYTLARAHGAIAVGALAGHDAVASFSNHGGCVAMAAPGVRVRSAYYITDAAYARSSGTSMTAPFVSRLAALILGERPFLQPHEVLREMQRGARRVDGMAVASLNSVCDDHKDVRMLKNLRWDTALRSYSSPYRDAAHGPKREKERCEGDNNYTPASHKQSSVDHQLVCRVWRQQGANYSGMAEHTCNRDSKQSYSLLYEKLFISLMTLSTAWRRQDHIREQDSLITATPSISDS
jgi:Subtilase family